MFVIKVNEGYFPEFIGARYYSGRATQDFLPSVYVTFAKLVMESKDAKMYRSRRKAERVAKKLLKVCGNVYTTLVEELSDG